MNKLFLGVITLVMTHLPLCAQYQARTALCFYHMDTIIQDNYMKVIQVDPTSYYVNSRQLKATSMEEYDLSGPSNTLISRTTQSTTANGVDVRIKENFQTNKRSKYENTYVGNSMEEVYAEWDTVQAMYFPVSKIKKWKFSSVDTLSIQYTWNALNNQWKEREKEQKIYIGNGIYIHRKSVYIDHPTYTGWVKVREEKTDFNESYLFNYRVDLPPPGPGFPNHSYSKLVGGVKHVLVRNASSQVTSDTIYIVDSLTGGFTLQALDTYLYAPGNQYPTTKYSFGLKANTTSIQWDTIGREDFVETADSVKLFVYQKDTAQQSWSLSERHQYLLYTRPVSFWPLLPIYYLDDFTRPLYTRLVPFSVYYNSTNMIVDSYRIDTISNDTAIGTTSGSFHYNYECISTVKSSNIDLEVSVYPNPTTGNVFIEGIHKENAVLRVSDLQGRVILTKQLSLQVEEISLQALAAGIYLYTIDLDGQIQSGKIVKQ